MSLPCWLCLGGLEVANNSRTVAYARQVDQDCAGGCLPPVGDCGCCPGLEEWLEDDFYIDPVSDPAPWYDPSVPESKEFYGLLVQEVTGLGSGKLTRETVQRASGQGSILGRPVQESPVITVSGLLLATSCCGADYGRRWLSSMLRGACGDDALCNGEDLTFLTCCPDEAESPGESPGDLFDPFVRRLKGVALISGPEVVETFPRPTRCPCPLEKVEFQLSASWPCTYTIPATVAEEVAFVPWEPDEPTCRFHWVTEANCRDVCAGPQECLVDPNCPPPEPPPRAPAITNPCTCAPWRPALGCADVDASAIPDHAQGIPIITVRSGASELKHVSIRLYENPLMRPPEELDPCAACGQVLLSRIPPDSVFVMDGTDRRVTVTCPGSAPTDASTLLAQAGGRLPFSWPVIECGTMHYTLCVEVDADTLDEAGASFDVAIAAREC